MLGSNGGYGRQASGAKTTAAVAPRRSLLQKGELAVIAPGVEGWAAVNQLINSTRDDTRNKKNCIVTTEASMTHTLSMLAEGGMHHSLLKEIWSALARERAQANRGECCDATDFSEELLGLIKERLPPHVPTGVFEMKAMEQLEGLPSRYNSDNQDMSQRVAESKLVLPPHAQLQSSSQGDSAEGDDGSQGLLQTLARRLEAAKARIGSYIRVTDAELESLESDLLEARRELATRRDELAGAQAVLAAGAAAAAAEEGAAAGEQQAGAGQQLQDAVMAAQQAVTAAEAQATMAQHQLDTRRAAVDQETSNLISQASRLKRDLTELGRVDAADAGSPVRLEDVYYTGDDGAEQAIFLPVLKALIVFRCMVCVPTPAQIQSILQGAKQGATLFAQEPVPEGEDIPQYAVRVKNYAAAAQLIGTPLDGANLLVMGLKNKEVRAKLELAMSVLTGPRTLQELARKALDIQAKQESMEMMSRVRGLYGGARGAHVAGGGWDDGGGQDGDAGSCSSGGSRLEAGLAKLTDTINAALAAGGFKQAGKFAEGNKGGGGKGAGSAPRREQQDQERQLRPKCDSCGRRHDGDCWPVHDGCGRRHNPDGKCFGRDYVPKERFRRRQDTKAGGQAGAATAAAAAGRGRLLTDAEVAAAAGEGLNVWSLGGGSNVAALLLEAEAVECLDDGLLGGAALAGGSLRQVPPASFHQARPGMLTRRQAKLAEQETGAAGDGDTPAGEGGADGDDALSLEGWIPMEKPMPRDESPAAVFKELLQIAPTDSHVLLALDPLKDAPLLERTLAAGSESALAVLRMPSMTFQELLERGKLGLLPAGAVAASTAALSAALGRTGGVFAEDTVLVGVKHGGDPCSENGAQACRRLRPTLPYLGAAAFKLWDVRDKAAAQVARMLVDSGANGALITRQQVEKYGLSWKPLAGVKIATADGGASAPIGVTTDIKLIVLPGTAEATAVAFDALVMDTGGKGVYDAILGREQMHLLGMVLDFGRQKCYIRPKLQQGCWDLAEVPWDCVRGSGATVGPAGAVAGYSFEAEAQNSGLGGQVPMQQAAVVAEKLEPVPNGGWKGEQQARLMASGDVEPNPGPLLERQLLLWLVACAACLWSAWWLTDAKVTQLLKTGAITRVDSGHMSSRHVDTALKVRELPGGQERFYIDHRECNRVMAADREPEKALAEPWGGEKQAGLERAGDVEPNPGPFLCRPCPRPGVGESLVMLVCVLAACTASMFAVSYVAAGWPVSAVVAAAAACWMATSVCVPTLAGWACLRLELPKLSRAWRPGRRLSLQLLASLSFSRAAVQQRRLRAGASWTLLLLVMLASCGVATATAGAWQQGAHGFREASCSVGGAARGVGTANNHPWTVELVAGEVSGAFTTAGIYGLGQPHPSELLEVLQPAGERDKPELTPEVTVDPDGKWQFAHNPVGTPEEHAELQGAVRARKRAFAYSHAEMPGYKHKVGWKMKHNDPIKEACHSRKRSPAEEAILNEKCEELHAAKLISEVPTTNPYAAHPVLAAKKDPLTGQWTDKRLCIDYRKVNKGMVTDSYTTPLPEDIFARAAGCQVWSVIDMRAGFHQLVLDDESARTTAFWWGRRLMQYNRLSFGTKNATAIYQRVMDEVLREGGCADFAMAYVDDLIIFSPDMKTHVEHVKKVLDCLYEVGLRAHPEKSIFGASQVEYLGHMVSADGVQPTQAKVAAILALPSPKNLSELRCIMGILNYYRMYIPGFSKTAAPIYGLLKEGVAWEWTTEREAAYQSLKHTLAEPGVVLRPADPNRQYVLHTDWSVSGIGAVLGQVDADGREYMVACASRSLNQHEKRYTPWKGELLAAVWGIKVFRHYLHGAKEPFRLVTDHRPLLGLLTTAEPNCQQVRWIMAVQDHDFVVEHRPGIQHTNADALSRFPDATELDTAGARMDRGPMPAPVLPDVVMPDGRHLPGEQAAEELPGDWQEQMLLEHQPAAGVAAAVIVNSAQLDVWGPPAPGWMDDFAPSHYELAGCAAVAPVGSDLPSYQQHPERALQAQASEWVLAAQRTANSRNHTAGGGVDTRCCAGTFFTTARRRGITLFEPFGGLGAGLEMVLKHGIRVNRYVYADTSGTARAVMQHRLTVLTGRYPHLLAPSAWEKAFITLPMDVRAITAADVEKAVLPGEQWLVVAGWECQDLSPAGAGKGLRGNKSSTYYQLLQLLDNLQGAGRRKGNPALAYVLENTAFQYHWSADVAGRDFAAVCEVLGTPLEMDAARFGSRAHRLRNFWTNLGDTAKVAAAVTCAERPPGLTVQQILGPGRSPMPVAYSSRPPWYPCNKTGQPREALPTLMAYEGSYSFKPRRAGSIWDENTQSHTEPTAVERELALGYTQNDTAAAGVTEAERRQVLGRCMDANTLQALFGICEAWQDLAQREAESKGIFADKPVAMVASLAAAEEREHCGGIAAALAMGGSNSGVAQDLQSALVAEVGQDLAEDRLLPVGGNKEPWEDDGLLHLLQQGTMPEDAAQAERDRLAKRAKRYRWVDGKLLQVCTDGELRTVPHPDGRLELVEAVHKQCGHLGVRRTMDLLARSYQWRGMYKDVQHVVRRCEPCDRARVSFAGINPSLTPLPVKGMFYRWQVDLCGEFAESTEGYTYVMVAIEAYSKVLEVAPLKNKSADTTAAAFIDMVLCRYGACAEVCSDRGAEWDAAFSAALVDCMVVHRPTAAQHPQANGAAERSIQSVKRSIRKCAESEGTAKDWPKHLPWIRLGYNCSRQQSTKLAPYTLLYGFGPTIPPAVREQMQEPVDFDDAEAAATELMRRQALMRRNLVIAGDNLAIAQERDTLRYAQVRDGQYLPRVRTFQEGDYVYLRPATMACEHMKGSGLTLGVEPRKLRVLKARPDGSVELIGRDGKRMTVNASNLTLCHLPDIDGTIDLTLAQVDEDLACEGCGSPHHEADMLLCDNCLEGWHIWCLTPPLQRVPPEEEPWLCAKCKAAGVTEADIQERRLASALNQEEEGRHRAFRRANNPSAVQQRKDARDAAMQGRLVRKLLPGGEELWGRIFYRGNIEGHRPYLVVYQDGSEEICGNQAVAKRPGWLLPEGTLLPSDVNIPSPNAATAAAGAVLATATAGDPEARYKCPWPYSWCPGVNRSLKEPNIAILESANSSLAQGAVVRPPTTEGLHVHVQVRELLESLRLPRGMRYLDPFAGNGLMVEALKGLGVKPVTSDQNRGVWDFQASPLNPDLYDLVKPDIVISLVTEDQLRRFWAPVLRRCLAYSAAIVWLVTGASRRARGSCQTERHGQERCVYKLILHDPGVMLLDGSC
jgi:hypothetical protein